MRSAVTNSHAVDRAAENDFWAAQRLANAPMWSLIGWTSTDNCLVRNNDFDANSKTSPVIATTLQGHVRFHGGIHRTALAYVATCRIPAERLRGRHASEDVHLINLATKRARFESIWISQAEIGRQG